MAINATWTEIEGRAVARFYDWTDSAGQGLASLLLGPLGLVGLMTGFIWQRKTKAHYRSLYDALAEERERDRRYRITLTSVGDGIITTDSHGKIQLLNAAAEKLTGWDRRAARDQPLERIFRVVDGETGDTIAPRLAATQPEEAVWDGGDNTLLIDRNGGERAISNRASLIRDDSGNPSGMVLVFRDQTTQRDATRTLRRSHAQFRAVFDSSPVAMVLVRIPGGTVIEINHAACIFFGEARDAWLDRSVYEPSVPSGLMELADVVERATRLRSVLDEERHFAFDDGSHRTSIVSAHTFDTDDDRYCLLSLVDITERERMQRAIQAQYVVDAALADLATHLLAPNACIKDISKRVLHYAKRLTGSEHGFVASIDPKTGDQIAHTLDEMKGRDCQIQGEDARTVFPIGADGRYAGLWGHALNTRQAFFTNRPSRHPAAQGVPLGHIPLQNYLAVPTVAGDRVLGQIALGNLPGGYSLDHIGIVERLAALYGLFVQNLQTQDELHASETRFRHVSSSMVDIAYSSVQSGAGNFLIDWLTGAAERITGYTAEEILALGSWRPLLHEDDWERFDHRISVLTPGSSDACEYRLRNRDGQIIWVSASAQCLRDEMDPNQLRIYGSLIDISKRHEAEQKLRLNNAVIDSTRDGVLITDLNGCTVAVNRAYIEISGYSEHEILGKNPRMFQSGRHDPAFYQAMWASLQETGHWLGEIWNRRKNGEVHPEWQTISTVRDADGKPTHYVAVVTDISRLKQSELRLEHLAHYDPLTNLPNRLLVTSRVEHAMHQAKRHQHKIAVLFIDLDRFKTINDSLGHPAGDALLALVAKRLLERLRSEDTLGRLGGDEFLVLLEDLGTPADATVVARDLLAALEGPFALPSGQEVYISASIGISIYPDDGSTSAEMIRNADAAMYQVKDSGRHAYGWYTPALTRAANERLQMETRLRRAFEKQEFVLYYQPIVSVQDGGLVGAEALIRWRPAGQEVVLPDQFIRLAEQMGLIVPLGEWVLRQTCVQAKAWLTAGCSFRHMALNLSVRQFRQRDLQRRVRSALDETGLPPECLELEITEDCLMDQGDQAEKSLQAVKDLGVRVSIDDFGTGSSSLALLKRLPLDRLKIDYSFIRDVPHDADAAAITSTVIAMAQHLALRTTAEGVETESQLDFLRQRGCDAYQGFLFSPPLPADQFCERYLLPPR